MVSLQQFINNPVWQQLTNPPVSLTDPHRRRMARFTAALLVAHIGLLGSIALWLVFSPARPEVQGIVNGLLVVNLFAYGLGRLGRYRLSRWIYVVSVLVGYFALVLIDTTTPPERYLPVLLLAMLLAATLMSARTTFLIAAVGLLGLLWPARFEEGVIYVFAASGIIVAAYLRNRALDDLARQNQQLGAAEHRFRAVFDQTNRMICLLQPDGTLVDANQQARAWMLSANVSRMLWDIPWWLQTSMTTFQLRQIVRQAAGGEAVHRELRVDGDKVFELWLRPIYDADGQVFLIVLEARDVSKRIQTEAARQTEMLRYRALFEQMNDGVFLVGMDKGILAVNEAGLRLIDATGVVGHAIGDYLEIDGIDASQEQILRRQDGIQVPVEVSATLVRDMEERPLHYQYIVRDLTGKRRIQRQQIELLVQQERLDMLQQLITNISHDMRTPLSNIKTSAYLLGRIADAPKRAHYVEVIEDAAEQLQRVVDDQLDLLRTEDGAEINITLQPVDINELLRDALAKTQEIARSQQHHLQITSAPDLPTVLGISSQLETALVYVLQRSLKVASPRSTVTIKTGQDSDVVFISVSTDEPLVSDLETDPVFIMALKPVHAHGGNIQVQSLTDGETAVVVRLPLINHML